MARHTVTDELIEKMILKVFDEVQGVVVSGVESLLLNMHGPKGSRCCVVDCVLRLSCFRRISCLTRRMFRLHL